MYIYIYIYIYHSSMEIQKLYIHTNPYPEISIFCLSARFVSSEALSLWAALGGCNCKVRGAVCERLVALIFGLWNHCSWHEIAGGMPQVT